MEEIVRQVLTILRSMWQYRWPALAASWVVAVAGVVAVFKVPDQYEASARIYVDTQSILKPLMAGLTVQPNVEQQISMLSRTLISRPNIEKLVRMADMDLKADTKAEQEALVERLTKEVQIRNTGRDNLYSLVFRDNDQEKAKRVIQSMVSIFVESSLGATRKDTDSAKTFLNDQIKQYEARLEEAEARVKEFKIRNIDLQTAEGKDATTRVGEAANQLQQARLALREAEDARNAVKAQIEAEKKGGGAGSVTPGAPADMNIPVSTPEVDSRIDAQKRNLDALLQRYTEQHPEVILTRRQIKDLEEQKAREVAELRQAAASAPAAASGDGGNVVLQELGRMLAASEVQVASLKARVGEYTARFAEAREGLKTAPQLEAEAAQLNRDYDIIRKNYSDLVSRRQSAIMSGELEVASGVADFRLIDPPRVSPRPVAPDRVILLLLALAAAVAAGLAVAFAASQLRPVFSDGNELRVKTGMPLLGVVSLVMTDVDRRRERRGTIRFFGATGSLVGMFVLIIAAMAILTQRGG
jgi:polysaccharide chain length determinant protein (PEP-CTERM system associated)